MKTKFDDNVAKDIPITKNAAEPELPWKMADSEISRLESTGDEYKAAITTPPLRVRAIFVVLLVLTIFVVVLNSMTNIAVDNAQMRREVSVKSGQVSSIQAALNKTVSEKDALSDSAVKLEKRVSDLSAQKELYTAVIETLTKKTDDGQAN